MHINGGRIGTGLEAVAWAREVERLGAGEIVLTSMDADGTKDGYDLEITAAVSRRGVDSGGGQRRGRAAPSTWPTRSCWAGPTRPWRPAFSTTASTRSHETKQRDAPNGAFPCGCEAAGERTVSRRQLGPRRDAVECNDRQSPSSDADEAIKNGSSSKHEGVRDRQAVSRAGEAGGERPAPEGRTARRIVRVNGTLRPLNRGPIDDEEMVRLIFPMMNERNRRIFDEDGGADFAYSLEVDGKTVAVPRQRAAADGPRGAGRPASEQLDSRLRGLHLPPVLDELCKFDQGMILLAGVTGSGKSTTIASMLNWINQQLPQAHPHAGRPDRVHLHRGQVPDQPARDRHGREGFRDRHEARRARRPRRDAGGRNARPGDVRDGDPRRRDGAPGVRHDPRLDRAEHHRPYSRPVSRRTCTPPSAARWPST